MIDVSQTPPPPVPDEVPVAPPWNPDAPPEPPAPLWSSVLFLLLFAAASYAASLTSVPVDAQPVGFVLAAFGLTRVLVDSKITKPVRIAIGALPVLGPHLYKTNAAGRGTDGLLTCYLCASVWIGFALAAVGLRLWAGTEPLDFALQAFAAGGSTVGLNAVVSFFESRYTES